MKSEILERIRAELRANLERLTRVARDAHEAATDPGSKAEGKYDTRSLEASYLAAGQGRQVAELGEALRIFEGLALPDFGAGDEIDAGALVEVEMAAGREGFLLVPAAGGMSVVLDGVEITLLTPATPLYQRLLGMMAGDRLDQPPLRISRIS